MAVSKDQIKDLLGSGLSNEIVASAVGCDPSYISQLLSDEQFYSDVVKIRTDRLQANNKRDLSIDGIEDRLISKLNDLVEYISKPRDVLTAFQVLNSAKRRGTSVQAGTVINNTVVNLTLPESVRTAFVLDQKSEIVEVDGRSMVTMTSSDLLHKVAQGKSNEDRARYESIAKMLPASEGR